MGDRLVFPRPAERKHAEAAAPLPQNRFRNIALLGTATLAIAATWVWNGGHDARNLTPRQDGAFRKLAEEIRDSRGIVKVDEEMVIMTVRTNAGLFLGTIATEPANMPGKTALVLKKFNELPAEERDAIVEWLSGL
jgi:hypothetical protein